MAMFLGKGAELATELRLTNAHRMSDYQILYQPSLEVQSSGLFYTSRSLPFGIVSPRHWTAGRRVDYRGDPATMERGDKSRDDDKTRQREGRESIVEQQILRRPTPESTHAIHQTSCVLSCCDLVAIH
jgi:hypothetical protein